MRVRHFAAGFFSDERGGCDIPFMAPTQRGDQIEHVGEGLFMLKGAIATLRLKFMERLDCGDHWAWLAHVDAYENLREAPPLTLEELKKLKLILA